MEVVRISQGKLYGGNVFISRYTLFVGSAGSWTQCDSSELDMAPLGVDRSNLYLG